jgi:hypothetical protein
MEILESCLNLAGYGILSISTGRTEMPDEPPSPTVDTELTTNIVAAYVRRNQIGADQLPVLISTVHQFTTLGKPVAELDRANTRGADPAICASRLYRLPGMRLARADAQTASRYQPWIDSGAVP